MLRMVLAFLCFSIHPVHSLPQLLCVFCIKALAVLTWEVCVAYLVRAYPFERDDWSTFQVACQDLNHNPLEYF
jgi:hypothetical protein